MVIFVQRKPLRATAVQYTGDNAQEIIDFLGKENVDYNEYNKELTFSYWDAPADELGIKKGDYVVRDKMGWPQVYHEDQFLYLFDDYTPLPDGVDWNAEWNKIPASIV